MGTKVGEFFVDLVVDAATGNLSVKQLISGMGQLEVASLGTTFGVAKVVEGIYKMAEAATGTAVELEKLQDLTGIDPQMAQRWDLAAQKMHVGAGAILRDIKAVNDQIGQVGKGVQLPGELTGWLGIDPLKGFDAKGNPVYKNFFERMQDLAKPDSKYNTSGYSDSTKQDLLGKAFGADGGDLFRILQHWKEFTGSVANIKGMTPAEDKALSRVDSQWIGLKQQLVDVFQQFLTSGQAVSQILAGATDLLIAFKGVLAMPGVQKLMHTTGGVVADVITGKAAKDFMAQSAGVYSQQFLANAAASKYVDVFSTGAATGVGNSKIDITIFDPDRNRLGGGKLPMKDVVDGKALLKASQRARSKVVGQ